MRKRRNRIIFELCFVVFVAWIALLFVIFRNKPKKTPENVKKTTPVPSVSEAPASPTVTPMPDGKAEVFLLEREYRFVDGERKLYRTYRYDDNGRVIACVYEGEEGEYTYEYWDVSYLVKESEPFKVYAGETRKNETVYAPNGQMTIQAEYRLRDSDGGLDTIGVIECNEAGLLTRFYYRDDFGNNVYDEIIEYDGNGYIISDTVQTLEGGDYVTQSYGECDEEGRVIRTYSVDELGTKKLTREISYNGDGSRDETEYGERYVYKFCFDAAGREIYMGWSEGSGKIEEYAVRAYTDTPEETTKESKYYQSDGTLINTVIIRYDNQGNVIFHKRTDADGTERLFIDRVLNEDGSIIERNMSTARKLEYDSHGNLIRETKKIADDNPREIMREYEYSSVFLEKEVVEENAKFYNPVSQAFKDSLN